MTPDARTTPPTSLRAGVDDLVINSPFEKAKQYRCYDRKTLTFGLVEARRPAGYVVATPGSKSFDDAGIFVEIPLVNQIHPLTRVGAGRTSRA